VTSWEEFEQTAWAYGIAAAIAIGLMGVLNTRRRERLFTMQRLRPGQWTGRTVVGHCFLSIVCTLLAVRFLGELQLFDHLLPEPESTERRLNLASPLAFVVFLAISFTSLYVLNRTPVSRVGLSLFRWRANAILGAGAFLIAAPIVLAIYAGAVYFYSPERHHFEILAKQTIADYEWAILFLQTVVFAPIAEEWIFRGLLQGWLRRTNLLGHAMLIWVSIGILSLHLMSEAEKGGDVFAKKKNVDAAQVDEAKAQKDADAKKGSAIAFFCYALLLGGGYAVAVIWLYRPVMTRGLAYFMPDKPADLAKSSPDLWTANLFEAEGRENRTMPWSEFGPAWPAWKDNSARLAIAGSAFAFALLHFGWPSAVPLFPLGLVLGWLAYRTQNLVPGMVLHALFNLVAFITLWLTIHPEIIGNDANVAKRSPEGVGIAIVVPAVWWPR
jgi:membrane protease YdiL (CAAX protease family)